MTANTPQNLKTPSQYLKKFHRTYVVPHKNPHRNYICRCKEIMSTCI